MAKIGRNDRCPCGSGKKYKFCCLNTDKGQNIVTEPANALEEDISKKNSDPMWDLVVQEIKDGMSQDYDSELVEEAIGLWNEFVGLEKPLVKKPAIYAAALEYWVASKYGLSVTQKELAKKYQVSVASISQRFLQFNDAFEHRADNMSQG